MKRLTSCKKVWFCIPISIAVLIGILPNSSVLSQAKSCFLQEPLTSIYHNQSQSNLTIASTWSLQQAQAYMPSKFISTTTWNGTRLPNWANITFSTMPGISESGSFTPSPSVSDQLGYDPFRNWSAGQTPDSYMMLGDFQDSFKLQNFSLIEISQITGLDLSKLKLDSFGVMKLQTLGNLIQAIPSLTDFKIADVQPVLDLLNSQLSQPINPEITIGQLLNQSPHLQDLDFNYLPMDKYKLDTIPGIEQTAIAGFKDWQGVKIVQVPGLNKVPFNQFPNPINAVGEAVGKVDIAFGTDEQQRSRTISGSDKVGFAVPCEKDCAHIELSGGANVLGKSWVSGKYQLVNGGKGILASVNGGKEPTGRHPFGSAFKVAVWDISEVDGMMSQALFFRVCMRNNFVDLGCTPYFIGPVPFMTYKEQDSIFLGSITGGGEDSVSKPTSLKSSGFSFNNDAQLLSQTSPNRIAQFQFTSKSDCSQKYQGVVIDALSNALTDIEGNYDAVGAFVCNAAGNCGRPLGVMQFMSYRPDVRSLISKKSSGTEFLAKLDKGQKVTGEEMLQYFSPVEQQSLFTSDITNLLDTASQQIDPTTKQPFTGQRLIERTAQMHFGGVGIPVDADIMGLKEEGSVNSYGKKANSKYVQNLESMGCN